MAVQRTVERIAQRCNRLMMEDVSTLPKKHPPKKKCQVKIKMILHLLARGEGHVRMREPFESMHIFHFIFES